MEEEEDEVNHLCVFMSYRIIVSLLFVPQMSPLLDSEARKHLDRAG